MKERNGHTYYQTRLTLPEHDPDWVYLAKHTDGTICECGDLAELLRHILYNYGIDGWTFSEVRVEEHYAKLFNRPSLVSAMREFLTTGVVSVDKEPPT